MPEARDGLSRAAQPAAAGAAPARHFDLVSHWRITAPPPAVWAALVDAPSWPCWWPQVRAVQTLSAGDADGLGRRHRIEWATPLPYRITIEIELQEMLRHQRLRGRAVGDMQGEGIWLLSGSGDYTDITYLWRVELTRPWMRWLAPMLAPLFRWNHDAVMRAGGAGLARHLGARMVETRRPVGAGPRP